MATVFNSLSHLPEVWVAHRQTPVAHKLLANYLKAGTIEFPFDIPLRDGRRVRVSSPAEAKVFWQIFVRRCYRVWDDCRVVVDAGANVGIFSIWAAGKLPDSHIVAVEPCPETFARLRHNLWINNLEPRVEPLQLALTAQSGERIMSIDAESPRRRLIPTDAKIEDKRVVTVTSVSLADLMNRLKLEQIDLLKIDIEGSEWEVLHSTPVSVLRAIRRIQFEYHEVHARFGFSRRELFSYLTSAGHRVIHWREDKHGTGIAIVEQQEPPRSAWKTSPAGPSGPARVA